MTTVRNQSSAFPLELFADGALLSDILVRAGWPAHASMASIGHSLLDILQPPGNQWLEHLADSDAPLPEGVRVLRHEDGTREIFESGTSPHRTVPALETADPDRQREAEPGSRP